MKPLVTPDQMATADRAAVDSGASPAVLMERAGRAVARAVVTVAGTRYGSRVVVVCGKGNNGGDGYVAALALQREGLDVRVLPVGEPPGEGAAGHHLHRWRAAGGRIEAFDRGGIGAADVIVDAIFGTGFVGEPRGDARAAIDAITAAGIPVVAVDIPSGVDGTTGSCSGSCVSADVTVTFGAQKIGTAIGAGAVRSGAVEVVDIGIPVTQEAAAMSESGDVARVLPRRSRDSHKRTSGTVLVIGGSDAMPGAAVLAVRGAARAGAGYVNLATTGRVKAVAARSVPEAVIETVGDGELDATAIEKAKTLFERADAVAVGPGLGAGRPQRELLERLVGEVELPLVIDADGLNVLAEIPEVLESKRSPLVLTPHPAELARLLGVAPGEVQGNRLAAVIEASRRFGSVVILKGFRSLIGGPDGRVVVNPTGGPELATAGTGDVLTGICAAFMAAGMGPFDASWAAAYVHGVAGRAAAQSRGPDAVVAWDVAESIGRARALIATGSLS